MYSETIPMKQLIPWLTAALIPVTLQLGAGAGWVMALLTAGVCAMLVAWVWRKGAVPHNPILSAAQLVVIVLVLSQLIGAASQAWPGDNYPGAPLILLAICAWTCQKGARVAARVGCVLFWVVLILYPLVLMMGVEQVKLSWLRPCMTDMPWETAVLLLLPAAASILCDKRERWKPGILNAGAGYAVGAAITAGVLSSTVAQDGGDPFYTMTQSVSIFGIAQRFDAVISAGMTVGWYALICLVLCVSGAWAGRVNPRGEKIGVWLAAMASATGMLFNMHISDWILAVLVTVFWVIIPTSTQGLVCEKKK